MKYPKKRHFTKKLKSPSGVTILELMVTVAISFLIMGVVFEAFIIQKRRYRTEEVILSTDSDGNFAVEYLTGLVENAGYNVKHGVGIEAASDHYLTTVMDENDNGVIDANEVLTISINKDYRELSPDDMPTEIIHDPSLSKLRGKEPHDFIFDVYFDMDGDGVINFDERFESGYNLNEAPNKRDRKQQGAIKLFLKGPSKDYGLYLYTFRLFDDTKKYNPRGNPAKNPYIVNPKADLIVDKVDNFVIYYFDMKGLPLPIVKDKNGNRKTPNPPYVLSAVEMEMIRSVKFELLLKLDKVEENKRGRVRGGYPPGSVATYNDLGRPKGWSCGDPGFPLPEMCGELTEWDCFFLICRDKEYPEYGDFVPYGDDLKRILFTATVSPKNLSLNLPKKAPYEFIDKRCYEESFEEYTEGEGVYNWDPPKGIWVVKEDMFKNKAYFEMTKRFFARKSVLVDVGAELFWKTRGRNKGYDNYEVGVDIYFKNPIDSSLGGTNAGLIIRMDGPKKYYAIMLRNESSEEKDNGYDIRLGKFSDKWETVYGLELYEPFTVGQWYRVSVKCVDNTFKCSLFRVGRNGERSLLDDFMWIDEKGGFAQGAPALMVFNDGAAFDNFTICPIMKKE